MFVEFIKNHPSGIKKGTCADTDSAAASKWVEANYAKEITKDEHMEYVLLKRKEAKSKAEEAQLKATEDEKIRVKKETPEPTPEELKKAHMAVLNALDIDGLTAYIKENELEVEIEAEATTEDVVTLIDLAEEKKKE